MPLKSVRQKRSLINYRQSIVKRITQSKNVIHALLQTLDIKMLKGKNAWTQKGVDYLSDMAKPFNEIEDMEQLWRGELHTEVQVLQMMTFRLKEVTKKLDNLKSNKKTATNGMPQKKFRNLLPDITACGIMKHWMIFAVPFVFTY